jgi:hypothetical protein
MRHVQWVVKFRIPKMESLASPNRRFPPLELLEAYINARSMQLLQSALHSLLLNQAANVCDFAAYRLKQSQVGASRITKDASLDDFQKTGAASSQTPMNSLPRDLRSDLLTQERLQVRG